MKTKSNLRAGSLGGVGSGSGYSLNHNQAVKGLRVRSSVKAGHGVGTGNGFTLNHNQTVTRVGLRVKSDVSAGGFRFNHNQTITR